MTHKDFSTIQRMLGFIRRCACTAWKRMPFHAEFAGDIQYCSVCEIGFAGRTSYCPHCGAVMDGWRVEGKEND